MRLSEGSSTTKKKKGKGGAKADEGTGDKGKTEKGKEKPQSAAAIAIKQALEQKKALEERVKVSLNLTDLDMSLISTLRVTVWCCVI